MTQFPEDLQALLMEKQSNISSLKKIVFSQQHRIKELNFHCEKNREQTESSVPFSTLLYSASALRGVLWTAATTTTACNRLPSLVMLCEVDDEDEEPVGGMVSHDGMVIGWLWLIIWYG